MTDPRISEDAAKRNFFVISMVRLSGAIFVMLGILIVNGNIDLPDVAGYIIVLIGLVEMFYLPVVLARRWRSPDE